MRTARDQQIGYNRQVRLEWLDYTASLMIAGETIPHVKVSLEKYLKDQLSVGSDAIRGSRGKTISILLSIWVTIPKHLVALRDEALVLMKRLSTSEHLALHWGMAMTAYPFFGVVADTAGRMLNLQGSVATILLKNRMRELYGQREFAARSTRYVLYSFSEWGILHEKEESGVYHLSGVKTINDQQMKQWMIKAVLTSESKQMAPLGAIIRSPKLFPFKIEEPYLTRNESSLEYFRQGLDEEMVVLK